MKGTSGFFLQYVTWFMKKHFHILFALLLPVLIGCEEGSLGLGLPSEIFGAPEIDAVSPTKGGLEGGTTITVTGSGFVAGAHVYVGESLCGSLLLASTMLTCVTPSSLSAGAVTVKVVNPTGLSSSLGSGFTYFNGPYLLSVSPSIGDTLGGETVTMNGGNFSGTLAFTLGGSNCSSVTILNSSQATCVTSAHIAGVVDAAVTTSDLQTNTATGVFTYQPSPVVSSVSPSSGFVSGGLTINVYGNNFQSGATITLGASPCTSVSFVSATQLTCSTPAAAAGAVAVTVTNPSTQTGTLASAYTYAKDAFSVIEQATGKMNPLGALDGTGESGRVTNPMSAVYAGGQVYIADYANHSIRRLNPSTGQITTFAGGLGIAGYQNGTGTAARFSSPRGITTDGLNLYVMDTGNGYIRRIVISSGDVTSISGAGVTGYVDGTSATSRYSTAAESIATDGTYIYVADGGNNAIRKVTIATGDSITLAGAAAGGFVNATGGAARFNNPYGITTDGTTVYVADYSNHCVRQIDIATAVVTTFAGVCTAAGATDNVTGATARFNGPIAVTIDPTFSNVYVAEYGAHKIRRVNISTNFVSSIAGSYGTTGSNDGTGASARFNQPRGLATDGTDIVVSDYGNSVIRKTVIASGVTTTLAGIANAWGYANSTASQTRLYSPRGMAMVNNLLYVLDSGSCTLREFDPSTGQMTSFAGLAYTCSVSDGTRANARFQSPAGITTDGTNLYVSDYAGQTIRKVTIATGDVTTIAGNPGLAGSTDGIGGAARFSNPRGLAYNAGFLYVADYSNHIIRRIDLATNTVTIFAGTAGANTTTNGVGTAARFNGPYDLVSDGTYLYVVEYNGSVVRRIDIATATVTTLTVGAGYTDGPLVSTRFTNPSSITYDGTSVLYVADLNNNSVRKLNLTTGTSSTLIGNPGYLYDFVGTGPTDSYLRNPTNVLWTNSGLFISNDHGVKRIR